MKKPIKPLEELLDSVRDIEGFPLGKDEDILKLSNPPYYTACPNPYINDFIEENGTPYDEATDEYHRDPLQGDVIEGRTNNIYNLHAYHTKVPPGAITKYIRHFSKEGDIIYDGFGGSGMTGVAGGIEGRNVILSDLSTQATFMDYNNNIAIANDIDFVKKIETLIKSVESECSKLYESTEILQSGIEIPSKTNYVIYSDIYECPICGNEYVYWDNAIDHTNKKTLKEYDCNSCGAIITKDSSIKVLTSYYDSVIGMVIKKAKQVPVKVSVFGAGRSKVLRDVNESDIKLIKSIEEMDIPYWFPCESMMGVGEKWGDNWRAGYHQGITHTHHFYTKRNLWVLSFIHNEIEKIKDKRHRDFAFYLFSSLYTRSHRMNRYIPDHNRHVGPLSGTLYVSFLQVELNVIEILKDKWKSFKRALKDIKTNCIVSTQSLADLKNFPKDSIDYIFTDPPFGDNLIYSELNFIMESWLKVKTYNKTEAIVSPNQNKSNDEYKSLMTQCFKEYFKVLKPNRWITVVFHNSKSAIWNILQDSMSKAGFIITQVNVLDKKKGTTKQLTYANATKNDLVISAYKPKTSFQNKFLEMAGEGLEEEFIKMHLNHLPAEPSIERTEQMLYSKLLAYYVQRSYTVKYDASTFYKMLRENFAEEDGFWFTSEQVKNYAEYKQKMKLEGIDDIKVGQLNLFVSDEKSALVWLHNFLNEPQDFQAIHPAFTKVASIAGDIVPDLKELLNDNFILEDGKYRRPQSEDEKLSVSGKREKALMKEFEEILLEAKGSKKKIKECRKQAILFGFEQCYKDERFQDILEIGKKLNKKIVENDSEIGEFIEIAEIKVEGF